uniref:Death associated protein n=1 Tax=Gallus gallus TaxID=9031 RepID=A0A8V0X3T1_CHICK
MSSPPKEKAETRAGHPPAVKAGGMRIVQKHPHSSDTKEEKDKDDQDWETSSPPKPTVFISGVIARGDKDFPPAAAQVAHQKPHPSVEKLPHPQHVKQHIHQPRNSCPGLVTSQPRAADGRHSECVRPRRRLASTEYQ